MSQPDRANRLDLLNRIELFDSLSEDWKYYLCERFREVRLEDDDFVYRAGEASTDLYVLVDGGVALFTDTPGEPVVLRTRIEPGTLFGEVGVLDGSPRSLSARAEGATTVLRLDGNDLVATARAHEDMAQTLCQIAIGKALENRAAQAELARRREVRIRIGYPVEVRTEFDRFSSVLENLSLGGLCLHGVPQGWQMGDSGKMAIHLDPAAPLLRFEGTIAWRKKDRAGVVFTRTVEDHEFRVARTIHRLVTARLGDSSTGKDAAGAPPVAASDPDSEATSRSNGLGTRPILPAS